VRLVDDNGTQLGIKTTDEAREYAYGKNLDLVEVAAQADPPVAKVMDYGKYNRPASIRARSRSRRSSSGRRSGFTTTTPRRATSSDSSTSARR
jgi:translation initiation factor IF-3